MARGFYRAILGSLALPALTGLVAATAHADDHSATCKMNRLGSVSITYAADGGVLMPALIQGVPVLVRMDLTLTKSVAFRDSLEAAHLQPVNLPRGDELELSGGGTIRQQVIIPSLVVGGLRFKDSGLLVAERKDWDEGPPSKDNPMSAALLGANMFTHVDVELDLAHKTVAFYSQSHCRGQVVYWASAYDRIPMHRGPLEQELYFDMRVDGKKVQTTLDTSNYLTGLPAPFTKRLYGYDESSPGTESMPGVDGKSVIYVRAKDLEVEGFTLHNVRMRFSPMVCPGTRLIDGISAYDCPGYHPLKLGTSVLAKLHLYLATKEEKLYLTAATPD